MHISDGIIATGICVAADVVCAGAVVVLGRRIEPDRIPVMGFVGAALFAVSLIHFPLAGTSIHLGMIGLAGILLGVQAVPVVFLSLLFQSLVFQHGGLVTLGLNTLNMSAGALCAWLVWRHLPWRDAGRGFAAGWVGVVVPATLMIAEFVASGYGRGIVVLWAAYLVAGAVEGALTASVVGVLRRSQPEILELEAA
jgi:cobalt/nickel transport system permease protein